MNKKSKVALGITSGILLLAALGIGLWYLFGPKDPVYAEDDLPETLEDIKTLVLVKSGTFTMGNESDRESSNDPEKQLFMQAFYMDEAPVTYEEFNAYVKDGGLPCAYWEYPTYHQPSHPVTGISWQHAADFCNWRSLKAKLEPVYQPTDQLDSWGYPIWVPDSTANGFRLPTEAEFEFAARGGLEKEPFPWGTKLAGNEANYDMEKGEKTGDWWRLADVKTQKANGYGLYGMSGNVWQWCQDWYAPDYYASMPDSTPIGPTRGETKVVRGGSWGSISPSALEVHHRNYAAPGHYNYDIGFRCVRPVIEELYPNYEPSEEETTTGQDSTAQVNAFFREVIPTATAIPTAPESMETQERMAKLLSDYFPTSLYFQQPVDAQQTTNPAELARLIHEVCLSYDISPLFLLGVMAAESGVGTCSFPRWYNNPMAWDWQNDRMANGLPTYEHTAQYNRRFATLQDGFENFCKGIRNRRYFEAAKKDLYEVHLQYMGYEATEWMYAVCKIYRDVAGVNISPSAPMEEIGQYIYLDWEDVKNLRKKRRTYPENDMQGKYSEYFIVMKGGFQEEAQAQQKVGALQQKGFPNAQTVNIEGQFYVSLAFFNNWKPAAAAFKGIKEQYTEVAVKGK